MKIHENNILVISLIGSTSSLSSANASSVRKNFWRPAFNISGLITVLHTATTLDAKQ